MEPLEINKFTMAKVTMTPLEMCDFGRFDKCTRAWILALGVWNDDGIWDDTATWKDEA